MRMSMQRTLMLFAVGLAAFPVLAMALLIWIVNSDIRKITEAEFDKIGMHAARRMGEDTVRICSIINKGQDYADKNARIAVLTKLGELGPARLLDETYTARVLNEYDMRKISEPVALRRMAFGDSKIEPEVDGESGRIIDSYGEANDIIAGLKRDTDMEFSIYMRMNAAGDMLKIASTIDNALGGTRVGTYIPFSGGPDNGEIVRTILSKNSYSGVSYIDRKNYMMSYEPIVGEDGRVLGIISFGRPQSSFSNILKYFEGMRLGVNGYVWGIDLVRPDESVVRISRDGKLNGTIVEKDPMENRRAVTMEIISAAREAGDGKINVRGFKRQGNVSDANDVIISYTYFKPWNMVFCATVDRGDYASGVDKITAAADKFLLILIPLALIMLVFAGLLAKFAAARGTEMVDELITAANLLKFGDIRAARRVLRNAINSPKWSNREIYDLAVSLKKMSANLSALVSKVQAGGVNLAMGAERIASGAADIEAIADRRSGAVAEVSTTVRSIANSVELLNADARDAGAAVDALLGVMRDSGGSTERIKDNAKGIFEATESVALRLAIILERTENMVAAIATITAVSERTNMLTLNASLEAERAGEYGEGFAAVASEIGRLADRSAVSALRVSRLVSAMRSSVASGIAEMEQFTAHMRDSMRTIKMLSENLTGSAAQVADMGAEFDVIARGVSGQAESAVKISVSVHELNSAAFQTRNKAAELKLVTAALESTSEELRTKVSQFKVPEDDNGF